MSSIEKLSSNQVKLTIEVTKEQFGEAIKNAYPEVQKNVKVDGFRPGKVPMNVFVARYGYEPIYEEAVNYAINQTYRDAIVEHQLSVVDYPNVDMDFASVAYDKGFTYTATVYVLPVCELVKYQGIEFKTISKRVTKKEVEKAINNALMNKAENVVKDGNAENGDTVVIDFEGFVDGVAFEGGKAENYELVLGSGSFIPGFEDQLVGTKTDDEVDVHVTFPTNYHADLAGKDATFKVKVHEVKTKEVPELTNEFVEELEIQDVKTVEEYQKYTENNLKDAKEKEYENDFLDKLFNKLVEANPIDVPQVMIDNYAKETEEKYRKQAEQYKIPFETFLQFQGLDQKSFEEKAKDQAEKQIKLDLIIEAIIKKEEFMPSDEMVEAEFEVIAVSNKMKVEDVKKRINAADVRYQLQRDMTIEFLKKNNGPAKAKKAEA